jgi:hypothetical protein
MYLGIEKTATFEQKRNFDLVLALQITCPAITGYSDEGLIQLFNARSPIRPFRSWAMTAFWLIHSSGQSISAAKWCCRRKVTCIVRFLHPNFFGLSVEILAVNTMWKLVTTVRCLGTLPHCGQFLKFWTILAGSVISFTKTTGGSKSAFIHFVSLSCTITICKDTCVRNVLMTVYYHCCHSFESAN